MCFYVDPTNCLYAIPPSHEPAKISLGSMLGQEKSEGGARALLVTDSGRTKGTNESRAHSSLGSAGLSSSKRHTLTLEWTLGKVVWSSTELTGGPLQGAPGEVTGSQTLHKTRQEAFKARAAGPGDNLTSPVVTNADGVSSLSPQRSVCEGVF